MDPYSSSSQYSPYSTSSQYSSSSPSNASGSGYTPFPPSQHYSQEAGGNSSDQMYNAPYDSYYPSAPAGYIVDPTGTVPFTYPGVTTSNTPLDSTSRHSISLSLMEWQQSCGPLPPGSVVARHSISSYPPSQPTQRPSPTPPRHPSLTSQSSNTEVPAEEITETEPASNKRKKKDSSWVWHFFEKLLDPNGSRSARCLACKKVYKFRKNCGTGSLSRHLKNKHVDLLDGGKGKTQSQIVGGTGGLSTFRYKPELAKENLAKFIVQAELPFNITENEFFEKYIKSSFCPEYQNISRRTITREIERLFCAKKTIMQATLSAVATKIALTSDVWESLNHNHYICVTSHYIDENWILQKRILSFRRFEYPHNAQGICDAISQTCRDYGMERKIFSISFDNASENTSAISKLKEILNPIMKGKFFHIRCVCHIINLCVQDGMKYLDQHLQKLKWFITFMRGSGPRKQSFKECCDVYGLRRKVLQIDVKTRWNSTYNMLRDAIPY